MGDETVTDDGKAARAALLELARARMAAGDTDFSIKALCEEAGVSRAAFQACFSSRKGLMAALMEQAPAAAPAPADPWLERRLRVFERALTALEAKAEAAARDHALALARLEEKLAGAQSAPEPYVAAPVADEPVAAPAPPAPVEDAAPAVEAGETPSPAPPISKDEMLAFLETARRAAREAQEQRDAEAVRARPAPWRNATVAAMALLTTLAIFAVLTLGHAARAPVMTANGDMHRQVAADGVARLMARADSGDAAAQTDLALAYLRGRDVARDDNAAARWAHAAAIHGAPQAQYVLASLIREGRGVAADDDAAFFWFRAAAMAGHVKAMHNLAIAYAEGQGTVKDPATAAAWFARAASKGYRDSAFDLGVLYERGLGVPQNLADALKWYGIAADAGDAQSAQRVALLKDQIAPGR